MTLRTGLAMSCGFADESTWGVAVAPTVHIPILEESLTQEIERIDSEAIVAGQRLLRSQQWSLGAVTASGDVGMELNDQSKGVLLKHMFGGSSTTGPFSPADLTGLGLTTQVGLPDTTDGTVRPKTLAGGKVSSWEVGASAGEHATLGLSLAGKHLIQHRSVTDGVTTNGSPTITSATAAWSQDDVGKPVAGTNIPASTTILSVESATSATMSANATGAGTGVTFTIGMALTAVSYASNLVPFRYYDATILIGGSSFKVQNLTISGDNNLNTDRRFLGQRSTDEPLEAGLREYGGTLETEYFSDVAYRRFLDGTEAAMVVTFARGTKSIIFTMNVRFDGESPQGSNGRDVVGQNLPFTCVGTTTDASGITVTLDET